MLAKHLSGLLGDASYAEFQRPSGHNPSAGDVIDGASGIRKIKAPTRVHRKFGRSKYLLLIYSSHADCAADDLTPAESKALKQITESWR